MPNTADLLAGPAPVPPITVSQPEAPTGAPMPTTGLGGGIDLSGLGNAWMTLTDPVQRDRAIAAAARAGGPLSGRIRLANLLLEATGVPQAQRVGAGLVSPVDAMPPIFPGQGLISAAGAAERGAARAADPVPGTLEGAIGEVAPGAGAFASRQAPRVAAARLGSDVPGFAKTAEQRIAEGRAPDVLATDPLTADKYAGNINLQRIDAPTEVKDQIRLAQDAITPPVSQTHDETMALANEIILAAKATGQDTEALAQSLVQRQLKPQEVTAIRVAAAEQATNAANAAREAVKSGLDAKSVASAEKEILKNLSMQETLSGVTRTSGQTLDSFNIVVGAERLGNFDEALRLLGKLDERKDFISQLARIDPADQTRITKFIRDVETQLQKQATKAADPVDWKWWLNHVYVNGIMSGLSNVRNAIGNTAKVAKTITELYGATVLPNGPTLSAANAFTGALFTRGLARGASKMTYVFAHRISEDFAKLDQPLSELARYPTGSVGSKIADAIGLPSRAMLAVDGFFKGAFEEAFESYYAVRAAEAKGLVGAEREAFIADRIVNPTVEDIKLARAGAAEYTFNAPAGKFVSGFMKLRDAVPGAKLFIPFVNTPANIMKDALQSTPLGIIGASRAAGAFGSAESAMRYSRAILGSGAMFGIYTQMVSGNITGFNPYRPGTTEWTLWNKDNLEVALKTPWGDISLLNYPPFSTTYKFVASIQDTQRKYGADAIDPKFLGLVALRLAQTGFDESFFSSLSNIYNAIENPDTAMKSVVRQIISAPIPYSGALRLIDNVRGLSPRDPVTFQDYLANNIPLLADTLRPKLTALGPAEAGTGQGPLALLPSRVQVPHADEFERRLLYLKDNFGLVLPEPLQKDIGRGVQLTDPELYALRQNTYPKILDAMHAVMSAKDFQNVPEQEQVRRLRAAFDAARNDGKVETAFTTLLPRAKTPDEVARVALIGISSYGRLADRAKWIDDITKTGKMTPEAARAIDNARSVTPGRRPDPTVAEYQQYAPYVRQYLATKPFAIGTPQEWAQLEQARSEYAAARSVNASAPKPPIVVKYELSAVQSLKRKQLLALHPGLERFVSDSTYRWEP